MKKSTFWNDKSQYGAIHRPENEHLASNNGCLVVFVHGIFGDCRTTWESMPDWVLDNVGIDINVVSYSYPSSLLSRCSIPQAADDLRVWLDTDFNDFQQVIFVTHSTGGLIVKQLLSKAFKTLQQDIDNKTVEFSLSHSLWLRTRRVINIAVPHKGGTQFSSFVAKWGYKLLYLLTFPLLVLVRFVSQGEIDWGKNQIITALRSNNPTLLKLDEKFNSQIDYAKEVGLPFPKDYDICAKADLSVPESADDEERKLYFRGTHSSVKIPTNPKASVVTLVANMIAPFGKGISSNIVAYSMLRIAIVNHSTGIYSLIKTVETEQNGGLPIPTLPNSSSGSQNDVVEKIVDLLKKPADRPRQLVVTGSASVGKSMVTRMIAWQLGLNYLANPEAGNPVPLLIPMQQITVDTLGGVDYSWDTLWSWWLTWGESIYNDSRCNQAWLENYFTNKPVTIILDGFDDFLHNHPSISFTSLVNMLRAALKSYPNNSKLSVIIGIRSTVHGINRLVTNDKDIFEVLRLSTNQAKQIYPKCANWIDTIRDKQLLDFILTPLILANYEPDSNLAVTGKQMTQYSLLRQTIRTILSRSHLIGHQYSEEVTIELDHLDYAMMLIAWLFYSKSRGEISIEILRREASQLQKKWQHYIEDKKLNNENFYYESLAAESERIQFGFSLVSDLSICNILLQRSVFVPTGPGMVRFAHRQWQELALGQYLSLCVRTHHFSELGLAAFHSRIYKTAGEAFGCRMVSETCVKHILEAWEETHNTYITGNVSALLSWYPIAIEPKAIQLLLNEVLNVGPISRVVLMAGLSYRVLINQAGDTSLGDIRRALFPQIKAFANLATAPVDDPVISSLSWCYQKAFAEQLGTEQPVTPWPELNIDEDDMLKALPVICTVKDDNFILDERSKSLQGAFLIPVIEAYNDSNLIIRAVHYLYYLVVAQKYGVHAVVLSQELPRILTRQGEFEKLVAAFDSVPEILTLFNRCQNTS